MSSPTEDNYLLSEVKRCFARKCNKGSLNLGGNQSAEYEKRIQGRHGKEGVGKSRPRAALMGRDGWVTPNHARVWTMQG